MKIAIIGSKGIPAKSGGIQAVVENVSEGLGNLGCEVTVFSRFYYSDIKKRTFQYKNFKVINVRGIKSKRLDTITHSLIAAIKASRGNFDIIAFTSTASAFFAFIPKIFGKKVVFNSHGLEILGFKWGKIDKFLMKVLIKLTAWVLDDISIVSYSQLKLFNNLYNMEATLIPNGITPGKTKLNFNPQKYILFVGRLVEEKGVVYLIEAFNRIFSRHPQMKLKIVGHPVYSSSYYKILMEKASGNEKIEFLGAKYDSQLDELYYNAYCVVIPSLIESFSLVLLESLRKNGVVICSDIEQFRYLAKDYLLFFQSKSVDDLAGKLSNIITDEKLWLSIKKQSINFPFENYSWDKISLEYYTFYNKNVKQ